MAAPHVDPAGNRPVTLEENEMTPAYDLTTLRLPVYAPLKLRSRSQSFWNWLLAGLGERPTAIQDNEELRHLTRQAGAFWQGTNLSRDIALATGRVRS